jgi:hypothetical protein
VVFALLAMAISMRNTPLIVTRRSWLMANGLIVLAWVPWLAALALHWLGTEVPRATLTHVTTWADLYEAFVQYTTGTAVLRSGPQWLRLFGLAVGAVLLALGVWRGGRAVRVLAGVFGVTLALPVLVSVLTGWWLFVPHFMVFLFPALAVVIACGALSLLEVRLFGSMGTAVAVLALACWLAAQVAGLGFYYRHPPHGNDGLRELASSLRAQNAGGAVVLVTPPALEPSLRQYYDGAIRGLPSDFDLRRVYLPYEPGRWNADSLVALEAAVQGQQGFWLVYRPELDAGGAFLKAVQARYSQARAEQYGFGTLYLFGR